MALIARIAAVAWAWTGGAIIGLVVVSVGTLYGLWDVFLRLFGKSAGSLFLFGAISDTLKWWYDLHRFAFLGTGRLDVLPPDPFRY